jgi:hypothetical protein
LLYTALAETVRRTGCGEKESDVQSFARSSERRYYHASIWVRVRKERASVDQGWTLYVVTKEMSLDAERESRRWEREEICRVIS